MVRIYLDWNVYSNLRQNRNKTFSSIYKFLREQDSSILLVYSPAHLQDLKRSYTKSETGRIETEKDLEYLSELTKNHCLCYQFKEKTVYPKIIEPKRYFNNIYAEGDDNDILDIENIFDNNDPLGKLWHSYWKLLDALPAGIDFNKLDQLPSDYQAINDLFKRSKTDQTFGSIVRDVMDLLQNPEEFESIFKKIRTGSNKDLKIESDKSKWGNPFEYLDSVLKKSKLQKSFFDITTEIIENSNKKASRLDYFTNYYIQLDMFGYQKDKKLPNLIDDATHSFYAAHTDVFVTDDENTFKKSRALYDQLNISTEVVHSEEFLPFLRRKMLFNPEKSILEQIEFLTQNALILLDTIDNELNPSRVYKVEPLLLNYFNRMQISDYENSTALIFYKKQGNYSDFLFWSEITTVIDKFTKEFGTDTNGRKGFIESEKQEIDNDTWKGRIWHMNNHYFSLKYIELPFGLVFQIDTKKPNR